MRVLTLLFLTLGTTASAGALDGFYSVDQMIDQHGPRSADQLMPEGCWSREVWAFKDNSLSRGHQRVCTHGKHSDTCEAWLTIPVTFDTGLTVPFTVEATSQSQTVHRVTETKNGETNEQKSVRTDACKVHVNTGSYQVTLQDLDGKNTLVLEDARRAISWHLVSAEPTPAPFKGVAP